MVNTEAYDRMAKQAIESLKEIAEFRAEVRRLLAKFEGLIEELQTWVDRAECDACGLEFESSDLIFDSHTGNWTCRDCYEKEENDHPLYPKN